MADNMDEERERKFNEHFNQLRDGVINLLSKMEATKGIADTFDNWAQISDKTTGLLEKLNVASGLAGTIGKVLAAPITVLMAGKEDFESDMAEAKAAIKAEKDADAALRAMGKLIVGEQNVEKRLLGQNAEASRQEYNATVQEKLDLAAKARDIVIQKVKESTPGRNTLKEDEFIKLVNNNEKVVETNKRYEDYEKLLKNNQIIINQKFDELQKAEDEQANEDVNAMYSAAGIKPHGNTGSMTNKNTTENQELGQNTKYIVQSLGKLVEINYENKSTLSQILELISKNNNNASIFGE